MKRRTTLLRLSSAALICFGGLALLNYSAAQDVKPAQPIPPATPFIEGSQPPNGLPSSPIPPTLIKPGGQFVPPNGPPIQVGPGFPGGGPNGGFPGVGPNGGGPGGKFNGPIPNATVPVAYTTKEGKKGWKVTIPGNRPLATPAVVDGKVFIGGGFGSYEFYSLDAKTGKQNWVYRTGDDGPTAAVVSDGYVAFNTESCEIEIITMDGKQVWKKWLGDPLMSMPAISQGKVYQSYPGNGKHLIACFDLKTGQQHWTKELPGQIVTAPIISKGKLYATSLEGSMTCMELRDGAIVWQEKKNATSAPVVWNNEVFFSRRHSIMVKDSGGKEVAQQMEAIASKAPGKDGEVKNLPATEQKADYLDIAKREKDSKVQGFFKSNDASVGFGSAPAGAGLLPLAGPGGGMGGGAAGNIGQNTVNGVWAYQGSKPFIYKDLMYTSMGDGINCVDPKTQQVKWKKDLKHPDAKGPVLDANLTPPAIVNGKLFMGTSAGQVICMSASTGQTLWTATVEGSISFQPAVANGMVYVSTNNGTMYAIETGDANDHGWLMWGANAEHNGGID